ncbi:MAG TPA: hypothetical protein VFJ76_06710 [Solirubrobacterales bacterium]|nr:hypothetical protein [Solirubrobacterales bacterium]
MASAREDLYEVEEMLVQPGTYFNPQTEVVVIVDDSASPDQEAFENLAGYGGTEWVRVSDEVPVDEDGRDRALESFEARSQGGEALAPDALEESDDDFEEEEERPEGVPLEDEE